MRPAPHHPASVANARILERIEAKQAAIVAAQAPAQPALAAPSAVLPSGIAPALARILRPAGASRWLLPSVAAITPQYIEMTLRGALAGNHLQQWELFDLMLDTWPELAACAAELTAGVMRMRPIFTPYAEEDESPSDDALERNRLVSAALRGMRPSAVADENDLSGTIRDLIDGWFRGVTVLEIDWQYAPGSQKLGRIWMPRATIWAHPTVFAWGNDGILGLRVAGASNAYQSPAAFIADFPENKFLIGISKAKSGTAMGGAMLRCLTWWWCAANFASDWVLNLAQVFGLPFRWASYDPSTSQANVDSICTMLQNMGSAGWAAFPTGTTLELKEANKGSDHSPQGELLDRADRYARLVILGQTMSGSAGTTGKGGGQAFGKVEEDVKAARIEACAAYVAGIFNRQFIPAILRLNYGDDQEAPEVAFVESAQGDLPKAQMLQTLATAGVKIGQDYARSIFDIPAPEDGEDIIGGGKTAAGSEVQSPRSNVSGGGGANDTDLEETSDDSDPAEARAASALLHRLTAIDDDALFAKALEQTAAILSADSKQS